MLIETLDHCSSPKIYWAYSNETIGSCWEFYELFKYEAHDCASINSGTGSFSADDNWFNIKSLIGNLNQGDKIKLYFATDAVLSTIMPRTK